MSYVRDDTKSSTFNITAARVDANAGEAAFGLADPATIAHQNFLTQKFGDSRWTAGVVLNRG
jgi:hypothetical protein